MLQKIIKVGNSLAVTIPKDFAREVGYKAGDKVLVQYDVDHQTFVAVSESQSKGFSLSPELFSWLDKIESKYKTAIEELAKK